MRLREIINPEEKYIPREKEFTKREKFRLRQQYGPNGGMYGYATDDPDDPHMINKHLYSPSSLDNDSYYQYIKAIKPYIGSNPYFPRVYIIGYETDPAGRVKPSYKMEKLIHGDLVDGSYYDNANLSDEERELRLQPAADTMIPGAIRAMSQKIFGPEYGDDRWSYLVNMIEVAAHGGYPRIVDKKCLQAIDLIKQVKDSNKNFFHDLHEGNMMVRLSSSGPQLVFTDPLHDNQHGINSNVPLDTPVKWPSNQGMRTDDYDE